MAILNIKDLTKNFGHVKALYNVTLSVEEGGITSLIGPNGADKTTFYNLVTGAFPPAAGNFEIVSNHEHLQNSDRSGKHPMCVNCVSQTKPQFFQTH